MNFEQYVSDKPIYAPSESFGSKVARELELAGVGIAAVPDAAAEAFSQRPLETSAKLVAATGLSFALGYATRNAGPLRNVMQSLGASMTVCATLDTANRMAPVARAFVDNWESPANQAANYAVMRDNFAPFAFDMALAVTGGVAGGFGGAQFARSRTFQPTLPAFTEQGFLPPGIHRATWQEFATTFGTTPRRKDLLANMEFLLQQARAVNGTGEKIYVGGSFVTTKPSPKDFDMTWRMTGQRVGELQKEAPLLACRRLQQEKLGGQLMVTYPNSPNDGILGYLQTNTRINPRRPLAVGVVELDLKTLPNHTSYRIRTMLGKAGPRTIANLPSEKLR